MKCPNCGNDRFIAHQRLYVDVIVDSNNNWQDNLAKDIKSSIYEADSPYGPYTCTVCNEEYSELSELKGDEMKTYTYYINLNERGTFYADVRDPNGKTVYEIKIETQEEWCDNIFQNGYMKDADDVYGLSEYLKTLGIIEENSIIEWEE